DAGRLPGPGWTQPSPALLETVELPHWPRPRWPSVRSEQLLRHDRQVADALARRVVDRVGDRRRDADDRQLRQPLGPGWAAGFAFRNSRPPPAATCSGFAPFSGEASSPLARASTLSRAASAASWTAEPTLAMVIDPPWTGALGRRESPSSKRTLSAGRPSASA